MTAPQSPYGAESGGNYGAGGTPQKQSSRQDIDAGKLWLNGVGTAIVTALAGVVTYFILDGVFGIDIIVPESLGSDTFDQLDVLAVVLASAVAALLATGFLHVLLLFADRPSVWFSWIAFLVALLSIVWPLTFDIDVSQKVALVVLHTVVAAFIIGLLGTAEPRVRR